MGGDRDVSDASSIVREEDQDEQETVGHGRDDEEIGRHDLAHVIPQERAPGLGGRRAAVAQVFRDRRLTDVDPQFQQFAMDPRSTPTRVRLRHRANQHGRPLARSAAQYAADFSNSTRAGSPVGARRFRSQA